MKEYKYKINGSNYKVVVGDIDNDVAQVEVNGVPYMVELDREAKPVVVTTPKPAAAPRTESGEKVVAKPAQAPTKGYVVKAPLPGTVLKIEVNVGDTVKAADTVIILEAMKMENAIHAERDGVVSAIAVKTGDSVMEGSPLITIG